MTVKRGNKRVPKSEKLLKKQLARKKKSLSKRKTKKRKTKRKKTKRRKRSFGLNMGPYPNALMMDTPYFELK